MNCESPEPARPAVRTAAHYCKDCRITYTTLEGFRRHRQYDWHKPNLGSLPLFGLFDRLVNKHQAIVHCGLPIAKLAVNNYRPDYLIKQQSTQNKFLIILEVDPRQHVGNGPRQEQDRMMSLLHQARSAHVDFCIHFVRFNPDPLYKQIGPNRTKLIVPLAVRYQRLFDVIVECFHDYRPISIRHLYYNVVKVGDSLQLSVNQSPHIEKGLLYLYDDPIIE
ncbi:hypothetical protein HDU85_007261 [Gaertneriomyces sp. JEL0708]|nr:hypothetical protein HDU85_007261 [Gaertneriomyces sp. JEL0708]